MKEISFCTVNVTKNSSHIKCVENETSNVQIIMLFKNNFPVRYETRKERRITTISVEQTFVDGAHWFSKEYYQCSNITPMLNLSMV